MAKAAMVAASMAVLWVRRSERLATLSVAICAAFTRANGLFDAKNSVETDVLVKRTKNLLSLFLGNTLHRDEFFNAGLGHAANATKALQEFRTLFGTDTRDIL
jgi:hypothetical protein